MIEVRPMEERDRDRVVELHRLSFQVPEYRLARQRTLALDQGWVVTEKGTVMGALRAEPLGQYFSGAVVPSAVVTAVKIAPEARGRGLGRRLMIGTLTGLKARGSLLSVLYASTPGLYRAVGYEAAGASARYRVPPAFLPRGGELAVEPWTPADPAAARACYRAFAEARAGLIDRSDEWWGERIVDPYFDRPTYRYLAREDGAVTGYLVLGQSPAAGMPYGSSLTAIDLVWNTERAARALLGFGQSLGPLTEAFGWPGPLREPLAALLDARPLQPSEVWPWMLRVIDPAGALEARHYPADLRGSVRVAVVDPALGSTPAPVKVTWSEGRARVEPAGAADLRIDVRGLAALYTGWLGTGDLARLGLLGGGAAGELALLDRAFRGAEPWMIEVV